MTAIEIRNLSKLYKGKRGQRVEALLDLSLAIEPGEVFGFLGPNGAGKSTTIKTIMGLISPSSGSAAICGIPVADAECRKRLGYLPENPAFYDFLTAREYLDFVGREFGIGRNAIKVESDKVLELLELSKAADRPIRGYSKGMVQRLGLAQALLHDPDVYVLDEPMSGLDPLGRALVKDVIKDLKSRGKTVFFSTHITADVEVVCDRVGIIVEGRLKSVNAVDELLEKGIEGYNVRARHCSDALLRAFSAAKKSADTHEIYVPRDKYREFTAMLFESGGEVDLIETKRKDLEAFFLDIVAKEGVQ